MITNNESDHDFWMFFDYFWMSFWRFPDDFGMDFGRDLSPFIVLTERKVDKRNLIYLIPERKIENFTINKNLYEQFKQVAQKDMRKYSNIIEGSIKRYVQSKL